MPDGGSPVLFAQSTAQEQGMMALRDVGVRQRMSRIEGERTLEDRERLDRMLRHPFVDLGLHLQNKIIGVETVRPLAIHAFDFGETQARLDRTDDGQRDLVLKGEDIVRLSVVTLGPYMRSGCGINELPGYADAISRLAHAAFEHIAHAEFAADLLHVDGFALVGEA